MKPIKSEKKSGKYLVIGDLCMDVFMQVAGYPEAGGDGTVQTMHQHAGGSAANTAIALAKLGGEPILLTHTGSDLWAQQLLPKLETTGVRVDGIVQEQNGQTGLTFLVVSSDAERTMFTYRGANHNLQPDEISESLFTDVDFLHISSYACLVAPQADAVHKAVQMAAQKNIMVSLDVGVEPATDARGKLHELLPDLSLIVLGEPEALALTEELTLEAALKKLIQLGVQLVALKLGKDGCRIISRDKDTLLPGFPVQAVDSTGAGDTFCSGMIHGLTIGWNLQMAGKFANALGALAASRWGAGEELPSLKEVSSFLSERNTNVNDPVIQQLLDELKGI